MIVNSSKRTVLAGRSKIRDNILTKGLGLMFKPNLDDEGYVFVFKYDIIAAIHMLFVFFPIDILWLDRNKNIVEIREKVKPFTLSVIPKYRSRYFIEIPAGTIERTETDIGDKIQWHN